MKKLAGALVLEELVRFLTGPAVGLVEERTAALQQLKPKTYISNLVGNAYASENAVASPRELSEFS